MKWVLDDGGRRAAGYKGETGDCVVRAIAVAVQKPYQEVYDDMLASFKTLKLKRERKGNPRHGVPPKVYRPYLERNGWQFVATMSIGSGCRVHLKTEELPQGRIIVSLSRHLAAVVDGVLHDTHDSTRNETRCVYGYFYKSA